MKKRWKYRGYVIEACPANFGYKVVGFQEVAANLYTAKKWIRLEIHARETRCKKVIDSE